MIRNNMFTISHKNIITDMEKMVNDFFDIAPSLDKQNYPPFDIVKNNEGNLYIIRLACAGFKRENLEVDFSNNKLKVSGEITEKTDDEYISKGIATRSFIKWFTIGSNLKLVDAKFNDGILEIVFEKLQPQEISSNKIEIK